MHIFFRSWWKQVKSEPSRFFLISVLSCTCPVLIGRWEKMAAVQDKVCELKRKRAFRLSWKQEFSWKALEDVGKTPAMCCAVYCKFQGKAAKTGRNFEACRFSAKHHWSAVRSLVFFVIWWNLMTKTICLGARKNWLWARRCLTDLPGK